MTVETIYYSEDKPATMPKEDEWPLLCFHCGGNDDVLTDSELVKKWTAVYPQCKACRDKLVKAGKSNKELQCDAQIVKKKKKAADAELAAARKNQKVLAPHADAGEDVIHAIVGKKKQGDRCFIHRKSESGELFARDTCSWEKVASTFDSDELLKQPAVFKQGQTTYAAIIEKKHATKHSTYWICFDSESKADE